MQFKLTALTTVGVATVAAATGASGSPSTQCDTGTLLCCNSTETDISPGTAALLGLLVIDVGSVTGLIGVTCSPITVIGTGGPPSYAFDDPKMTPVLARERNSDNFCTFLKAPPNPFAAPLTLSAASWLWDALPSTSPLGSTAIL